MAKKATIKKATMKKAPQKAAPRAAQRAARSASKETTKKTAKKGSGKKATSRAAAPQPAAGRARAWRNPKAELVAFALTLPEAWEDHPWGEIVAKVGKKVFVFFGVEGGLGDFGLCVKLPESGPAVLELPNAEPAGYGLGKSGWVVVKYFAGDAVPLDDVRAWIVESYRAVASKTLLKRLDGE